MLRTIQKQALKGSSSEKLHDPAVSAADKAMLFGSLGTNALSVLNGHWPTQHVSLELLKLFLGELAVVRLGVWEVCELDDDACTQRPWASRKLGAARGLVARGLVARGLVAMSKVQINYHHPFGASIRVGRRKRRDAKHSRYF